MSDIDNFIQEKIDFIPDYKKIENKINFSNYIKQRNRSSFWKLASISLSIVFILVMIPVIIINNLPKAPSPIPNIEKIENTYFDNFLRIEPYSFFQEEKDTIVLNVNIVPWSAKRLKSLYIKGNTLNIISAQAFGETLSTFKIENDEYYFVDLVELNVTNYVSFNLFLNFEKNKCAENIFYSDIVNYNIIAQKFDIYINYHYEESKKDNLRFYYDSDDIYGAVIQCFNNVDKLLTNTFFTELYLPDLDKYELAKEIIYSSKTVAIRSNNYYQFSTDVSKISFALGVWVSKTGVMYGDQPKTYFSYNGIDYLIVTHEASVIIEYSIDFAIKNEVTSEIIQYSYLIKASSIEVVKEFIQEISLYKVN